MYRKKEMQFLLSIGFFCANCLKNNIKQKKIKQNANNT